jgi:hypothetical protein
MGRWDEVFAGNRVCSEKLFRNGDRGLRAHTTPGQRLTCMKEQKLPLRIVLVDPPVDVVFALQRGRSELHRATRSSGKSIAFDLEVRVQIASIGEAPNCLGPFVQGTRGKRFVYVNSGTYAGDAASCWSRRAKVSLEGITPDLVNQLERAPASVLEAFIAGANADGGPACASVPLLGQGWHVAAV